MEASGGRSREFESEAGPHKHQVVAGGKGGSKSNVARKKKKLEKPSIQNRWLARGGGEGADGSVIGALGQQVVAPAVVAPLASVGGVPLRRHDTGRTLWMSWRFTVSLQSEKRGRNKNKLHP